jgi:hypothetical protein
MNKHTLVFRILATIGVILAAINGLFFTILASFCLSYWSVCSPREMALLFLAIGVPLLVTIVLAVWAYSLSPKKLMSILGYRRKYTNH